MPFALDVGATSDVGRQRRRNEDSCALFVGDPRAEHPADLAALVVVADGMGGERAGDRASRVATQRLHHWMSTGEYRRWPETAEEGIGGALRRAIVDVGKEIVGIGEREPSVRGLGSTVVALAVRGGEAAIAHVGDSRCYRLRDGRLEQLTADHSWVQQQVRAGVLTPEQARSHPQRNVLTRSLGDREPPRPDLRRETLRDGDLFLLCSDGLIGGLDDAALAGLMHGAEDPQALADALVAAANERDGSDNITAAVARCRALDGDEATDELPTQPLPPP